MKIGIKYLEANVANVEIYTIKSPKHIEIFTIFFDSLAYIGLILFEKIGKTK